MNQRPPAVADVAAPQIAIIGTEGAGKTVLIATLAKRFSQVSSANDPFLNPLNNKTLEYVEKQWKVLTSGEWPSSTRIGEFIDLRWRLRCGADSPIECDVRLIDPPGQDLRRIFSEDQPDASQDLPEHLRALAAYYSSADIVICLINLKDFMAEPDDDRRINNTVVMHSALRWLSGDASRRLYLLFTQIDQYQGIVKRHGNNLSTVAKQYVPYIYSAHVAPGRVKLGAVAAVYNTVVKTDCIDGKMGGKPLRVPAPDFKSRGFEVLMDDLARQALEITVKRRAEQERQQTILSQQRDDELRKSADQERQKQRDVESARKRLTALFAGGIMVALLALAAFKATSPPLPLSFPLPTPNPAFEWGIKYDTFFDDIWLQNNSNFTLHNVKFTVTVVSNGQTRSTKTLIDSLLPPGFQKIWEDQLSIPRDSAKGSVASLQFEPMPGAWGLEYGRFGDEVWVRNDGSRPVQASLNVVFKDKQGTPQAIPLQARLRPGETFKQRARLPRGGLPSASLESWREE